MILQKGKIYFNKNSTEVTIYVEKEWWKFTRSDIVIDWKSVAEPPKEAGWYIGALLPRDFDINDLERVDKWRNQHGFTKVWFNPMASGSLKWFEPDAHGDKMRNLTAVPDINLLQKREDGLYDEFMMITHWAYPPPVPKLKV